MKLVKLIVNPLNIFLIFFVLSPFILKIITLLLFEPNVEVYGGCFNESVKFGFPLLFYSVFTECLTTWETSKHQIREFSLPYFAIDILYFSLLGFLVYRIYKQSRIK